MDEFNRGDIVGRKSYNLDIFFKVIGLFDNEEGKSCAHLKGIDMRLCADAPLEDLVKIETAEMSNYLREQAIKNDQHFKRIFSRRQKERDLVLGRAARNDKPPKKESGQMTGFDVPGIVLHIDGDSDYLDLCLTTYRQLNVPANGYNVEEKRQPEVVGDLLKKHRPDLLVLTGHDGFIKGKKDYKKIENYYSSKYFVNAVRAARHYEKSKDDLIIFAGACQSHYESILEAGANFASSPQRVMIHAYDPVFIMEKIAYTSIYDPVSLNDIISGTITGFSGIGGLETRGKFRIGLPKSPY